MAETFQPGVLKPEPSKRRPKVRVTDIIIFMAIIAVIAILGFTLIGKLTLKHDVANAKTVSDQTIAAVQKRDGAAARKLSDKDFQSKNTDASLTKLFKNIEVATLKQPELDRQTVYHGTYKTVYFIYRYNALKVPFFVRVGVSQESGKWQLSSINGSADESKLIIE